MRVSVLSILVLFAVCTLGVAVLASSLYRVQVHKIGRASCRERV